MIHSHFLYMNTTPNTDADIQAVFDTMNNLHNNISLIQNTLLEFDSTYLSDAVDSDVDISTIKRYITKLFYYISTSMSGYHILKNTLLIHTSNMELLSDSTIKDMLLNSSLMISVENLNNILQTLHASTIQPLIQNAEAKDLHVLDSWVKNHGLPTLKSAKIKQMFFSAERLTGTICSSLLEIFSFHGIKQHITETLQSTQNVIHDSFESHNLANRIFLQSLYNTTKKLPLPILSKLCIAIENTSIHMRQLFNISMDLVKATQSTSHRLNFSSRKIFSGYSHFAETSVLQLHTLISNYLSIGPFLIERKLMKMYKENNLYNNLNNIEEIAHALEKLLEEPIIYDPELPAGSYLTLLLDKSIPHKESFAASTTDLTHKILAMSEIIEDPDTTLDVKHDTLMGTFNLFEQIPLEPVHSLSNIMFCIASFCTHGEDISILQLLEAPPISSMSIPQHN